MMIGQKIIVIWLLLLGFSINTFANDKDRMDALEAKIQLLEARLEKLESANQPNSHSQDNSNTNQGWKSISSWRKLTPNMTTSDVQKILGDPYRLNGGDIATWYYQNGGTVTFISGKVYQWNEPRA